MYSGITQGLYPVVDVKQQPGLIQYAVQFDEHFCQGLVLGASVSIDGVCQTVVSIDTNHIVHFDAMSETLDKTTLKYLRVGRQVSAERSLTLGAEIGGHEVAGHVIGMGQIVARQADQNNLNLTIQFDPCWGKYIFEKGFIAVDGSSLTLGIVSHEAHTFVLHLIPETLRVTNFKNKKIGDFVNLELDHKTKVIVDTVERMMQMRDDRYDRI